MFGKSSGARRSSPRLSTPVTAGVTISCRRQASYLSDNFGQPCSQPCSQCAVSNLLGAHKRRPIRGHHLSSCTFPQCSLLTTITSVWFPNPSLTCHNRKHFDTLQLFTLSPLGNNRIQLQLRFAQVSNKRGQRSMYSEMDKFFCTCWKKRLTP